MSLRRLVSIAIPAYKPDFFEATLQSAFSQTHDQIEIVICDDCKSDAMYQIVERLRPQSPWPIRYMRNQTPLGETLNVARCIRESRGEYIKFLYDDDLLDRDCISALVALFEAHPNVTLASSRRSMIDENGELQPDNQATLFPFSHDVIMAGAPLASFLGQFPINFIGEPSCVMVRRADVLAFGDDLMALNGTSITWVGDLAIYVKLMRMGDVAMLAKALSFFRVSSAQYSAEGRNKPNLGEQAQRVFRQRILELGWTRSFDEYRMLKIAPLAEPTRFSEVDLLPYFVNSGSTSGDGLGFGVGHWLAQRTVNPTQQKLIDERLEASSAGSSLLVVVMDDARQPRKLDATLHSILIHQALSPALNVMVLSEREAPAGLDVSGPLQWRGGVAGQTALALNGLLETHYCDWFIIVEAGASFTAHGISRLRLKLPDLTQCPALFADELHRFTEGRHETAFRPDFNLDYLLSYPSAMSRHWVFHRQTILGIDGFDPDAGNAMELDLILRLIENEGVADLHHLADPLLICDAVDAERDERLDQGDAEVRALSRHLHARGYVDSQVCETAPGLYQIRYQHTERPLVSILIPTKDQLGILSRCVESVLEKTAYSHYEIIIIDNNSVEADALEWLAGVESMQSEKVRVLRHPFPFNYSEINNMAARHARGEYLVLLNNDTAVLHDDWLDNLLNHGMRPEVGVVGAKLLFPDGAIQHGGVVMGIAGPAYHVFVGAPFESAGYMQRLQVDQDYSVVTAACMMVRKSLYLELGGLEETHFKVSYNDVDFCLRVREAGYLVVWTPHARLLHESSVSQIQIDPHAGWQKIERFRGEQLAMYRRWLAVMAHDPAYNPNFAVSRTGFELENNVDLTWRPLPWRPLPLVLVQRLLQWQPSDQRLTAPLNALREQARLDGAVSQRLLDFVELERLRPDTVVFQQPLAEADVNNMRVMKSLSPAFTVLDLDRLPASGTSDPAFVQSLGLVERVVVSSPALAESLAGLHPDIRVASDCLPVEWKQGIYAQRRVGGKMRVGWCGDDPQLDLALLDKVVRTMADEVDFIVMGWCPMALRPYVNEIHPHVLAHLEPGAMAAMNLDLALLPHRQNDLRNAQSQGRVLKFGACGFPVVCSDSSPGADSLPVLRLTNQPERWIETIRGYVKDTDALALAGDTLQRETLENRVLDGRCLEDWRSVWLR
ncbi:glycosyltransferase family 2 protein [Pseudomonas sp. NFR16]|uniref:glycosyltransferase family 2 protein n=1 Tax=Pseudomonas sp. NFR16 TaxID=1566248 RepID=UPI0008AF1812|nr:glycosyltransferase family 2 protein [Pseudomonas sp. NFR16]SEI83559.1 Glycosyltransferase, GT2 family [Pseudomonas sp. NFR16]